MYIMRNVLLSVGLILFLFNSVQAQEIDRVQAQAIDRGQLLYENHCVNCHTTDIHQRGNRKVNSLNDLSKMVIRFQHHLKLGWNVNDVGQVTRYLNQKFYQIPGLP